MWKYLRTGFVSAFEKPYHTSGFASLCQFMDWLFFESDQYNRPIGEQANMSIIVWRDGKHDKNLIYDEQLMI